MKLIFLDFDGVINSAKWLGDHHQNLSRELTGGGFSFLTRRAEEFDPSQVQMICDLVNDTDSQVVVSSSWRILHTLQEICEFLVIAGWSVDLPIDVTPRTERGFRGDEVEMWLMDNPEFTHHVIFDDDGDFHFHQPLVQTHWDHGVLDFHIETARTVLSGEPNVQVDKEPVILRNL